MHRGQLLLIAVAVAIAVWAIVDSFRVWQSDQWHRDLAELRERRQRRRRK